MIKKKSIFKSFYYAFEGLKASLFSERNMQIHFIVMTTIILLGFPLKISYFEWLICILLFGLVISLELINTAIESTIDICMPDINPLAKKAKDVAAGSVLIATVTSIIVGLIIFVPKIIILLNFI